ncbi:MAG: hypothetical protein VX777_09805, partial [Chlamydiota bacterium]|nr:hypothetical protein [Chlamydiota bacterium]
LFHMQEKLVNIQREYEDVQKSSSTEKEELFEEHIKKMEAEREQIEIEHQEEIDGLHEIIASLSGKS